MKEILISQIVPLLVTCIVAVVGVVIKSVGDAIIAYIEAKKNAVISKIGEDKYNSEKKVALDIWNIVDEHFRINPTLEDVIDKKIALFNELLLKKIPGLTQEQIDFLRQSIAGEVNKGKKVLDNSAGLGSKGNALINGAVEKQKK